MRKGVGGHSHVVARTVRLAACTQDLSLNSGLGESSEAALEPLQHLGSRLTMLKLRWCGLRRAPQHLTNLRALAALGELAALCAAVGAARCVAQHEVAGKKKWSSRRKQPGGKA